MSQVSQTTGRVARRVRHETKMRLLQVRDVQRITPKMVRIVVGGEDLTGFISAAHDDHVKVFFPHPGQEKPVLPTPSPNGPVYPEGVERPPSRDYTPRRYDGGANTLTLDFVLHDAGPATAWAAQGRSRSDAWRINRPRRPGPPTRPPCRGWCWPMPITKWWRKVFRLTNWDAQIQKLTK